MKIDLGLYFIETDSFNYTAYRKTEKGGKSGKYLIGHFGTVARAMMGIINLEAVTSEEELTLQEFIDRYERISEDIYERLVNLNIKK